MEPFSAGYYQVVMTIQPYEDGPVIERQLHRYIDESVYAQTDAPVTVRVGMEAGRPYFPVSGDPGLPTDVLALPTRWIDDMNLDEPASPQGVFILHPDYSFVVNSNMVAGEL